MKEQSKRINLFRLLLNGGLNPEYRSSVSVKAFEGEDPQNELLSGHEVQHTNIDSEQFNSPKRPIQFYSLPRLCKQPSKQ